MDKEPGDGGQTRGILLNTSEFIDKLHRAARMEEEMAGDLADLCHPETLRGIIPEDSCIRIEACLGIIQRDTQRHAQIVSGMISEISGEQKNG